MAVLPDARWGRELPLHHILYGLIPAQFPPRCREHEVIQRRATRALRRPVLRCPWRRHASRISRLCETLVGAIPHRPPECSRRDDRIRLPGALVRTPPCRRRSARARWNAATPRDFTMATMPARFASLGDVHAGIDDAVCDPRVLLDWVARDERDHNLGKAPFPPKYPKAADEPKRVQPSRATRPASDKTPSRGIPKAIARRCSRRTRPAPPVPDRRPTAFSVNQRHRSCSLRRCNRTARQVPTPTSEAAAPSPGRRRRPSAPDGHPGAAPPCSDSPNDAVNRSAVDRSGMIVAGAS